MKTEQHPTRVPECLREAKRIQVPVGTRVFSPGHSCEQFYFLLAGSIRVDLLSETGKAVLLYRFGTGESCTLTTACLFSGDAYCAEATVETHVTACVLPAPAFNRQFDKSVEFRNLVITSFGKRLADMMAKIDEVAFTPIDKRLAIRVLELADNNHYVEATHIVLAADIGTAREVISRKLASWEKDGWIKRGRGSFELLDPNKIQIIADSEHH